MDVAFKPKTEIATHTSSQERTQGEPHPHELMTPQAIYTLL